MSEQILAILNKKIDDLSAHGEVDIEIKRNVLKEELQFYVLDFIYHHPEYSRWIMYGGSALRICHGLDRMSVDLDFEISQAITGKFLEGLKNEIEKHFTNVYGIDPGFLTIKTTTGRGLTLKFNVGEKLSIGQSSKLIHVKIDLNHFIAPNNVVIERRPINRNQFSFVIVIYNMSALMASKIAAIFMRGTRGVGKAIYEEKGRDVYDLLWYMTKKVAPDFDYLIAKDIEVGDPRALFNKITVQMNKVGDTNLKQDLTPLFIDQTYIENWLKNWRESYLRLLDEYKINTITKLREVIVRQDFSSDNLSFIYFYNTENEDVVSIEYITSDYWIKFREGDLPTKIDVSIIYHFRGVAERLNSNKIKQYMTLFRDKNEAYFKKTNRTMLGDSITTKVIRMTADHLNQKEQIVLNRSALLDCELEDLLK